MLALCWQEVVLVAAVSHKVAPLVAVVVRAAVTSRRWSAVMCRNTAVWLLLISTHSMDDRLQTRLPRWRLYPSYYLVITHPPSYQLKVHSRSSLHQLVIIITNNAKFKVLVDGWGWWVIYRYNGNENSDRVLTTLDRLMYRCRPQNRVTVTTLPLSQPSLLKHTPSTDTVIGVVKTVALITPYRVDHCGHACCMGVCIGEVGNVWSGEITSLRSSSSAWSLLFIHFIDTYLIRLHHLSPSVCLPVCMTMLFCLSLFCSLLSCMSVCSLSVKLYVTMMCR